MWLRLFIFATVLVVAVHCAETSTRPKNCAAGTTYKKDCNVCTCAADPKKDKCGNVDCNRSGSSSTTRAPSSSRPGICPTKVTPAPGSNSCKTRTQTSTCTVDKDCPAAKKCCENGCAVKLCRNAIYPNTP
ncbi:unnamed protein product [Orchesella dallaii]|uniref:WAP domain-containing protein n=1 Tax=Orchesella dallaii TaxID=48710 RepID=A0ABP1PV99_9HEXA